MNLDTLTAFSIMKLKGLYYTLNSVRIVLKTNTTVRRRRSRRRTRSRRNRTRGIEEE